MYEVGVVAQFEAAHSLTGDFGPATRMHGHTYRVEILVRGPELGPNGSLYDLGLLQSVVNDVVSALHYTNLDQAEAFVGMNTTAEVIARHFADRIAPTLRDSRLQSLTVRVWESPQAYAGYEAPLSPAT